MAVTDAAWIRADAYRLMVYKGTPPVRQRPPRRLPKIAILVVVLAPACQRLRFLGSYSKYARPRRTRLAERNSMFDIATARRMMVDGQVRTADVTNPELISAMLALPRERFVPPSMTGQAYSDGDIAIGDGRALLKPMVLAKLIQGAAVRRGEHVLDAACGTGYSSALLGRLAGSVVALEPETTLAQQAKEVLAAIGATNVTVVTGPLAAGWPAAAPFDLILLNGATEVIPEALGRQLKPGGRLACIFGRGPNGKAVIYRPIEGHLVGRPIFDAAAPVLPGFVATPTFVF